MKQGNAEAERWLPVVGWEQYYEVSDYGRVRSYGRATIDRLGRRRWHPGLILKQTPHCRSGRPTVTLYANGVQCHRLVQHVVADAFIGLRPPGAYCCHENDIVIDNRAANLRWDTPSGNRQDRIRNGNDHMRNRTHCPAGHILAAPNLVAYAAKQGYRTCLACCRARSNAKHARLYGHPFDLKELMKHHYALIMGVAS